MVGMITMTGAMLMMMFWHMMAAAVNQYHDTDSDDVATITKLPLLL